MANPEHLERLKDLEVWNAWNREHFGEVADLSGADLSGTDLTEASLRMVNLSGANLSGARMASAQLTIANLSGADLTEAALDRTYLFGANLSGANLTGASLSRSTLERADLTGANLRGADLEAADLRLADLTRADLRGADLSGSILVDTTIEGTNLDEAIVYGASVWNVRGVPASQMSLLITDYAESVVTVDDLKIAQFVHLLLANPEIRGVIDTVSRKAVLILGRFTPERKAILDSLRDALRAHNYVPILFDFDKPTTRDLTETVSTLAHLSRFIIADLTEPSSIPQELQAIVPDLAVPVVPTLSGSEPYAMFADLQRKYHWVLDIHRYDDEVDLLDSLVDQVIRPAEAKALELSG